LIEKNSTFIQSIPYPFSTTNQIFAKQTDDVMFWIDI